MNLTNTEKMRLEAVSRFENNIFLHMPELQEIVSLAAEICGTPVALVTIVSEHYQLFKVAHGYKTDTIPRHISFCTYTLQEHEMMIVGYKHKDERIADNPLVKSPGVRFYAGANLLTHDGNKVGTLCVLGDKPKVLSKAKQKMLKMLAAHVIHLMELDLTMQQLKKNIETEKKQSKALEKSKELLMRQNQSLSRIAHVQSHEYRGPVASILGLMNIIREEDYTVPKDYLIMMEDAVKKLDEKISSVVRHTEGHATRLALSNLS